MSSNNENNKFFSKRSIKTLIIILLCIPATIFSGWYFFDDRKYVFISIVLLFMAMVPFLFIFEGKKPKARQIMVIAVLTAITIISRAIFCMIPNMKPVAAMIIIIAVCLGPETGFLVGCLSMLLSNIFFGQGPWTPWQMFTYGLIGFVAGKLYQMGIIKKNRLSLSIYGFLSVFIIFGGIMNPASLIMYTSDITVKGLISMYISGFPVDLMHATATVIFIVIGAMPLIEKIDRVKNKYGFNS